jgi:hypothetical protein
MADKIYWTDETEENGYERREWFWCQALIREASEAKGRKKAKFTEEMIDNVLPRRGCAVQLSAL